ncbi:MMPL/RND family transporter [Mycolicibacterium mengxianglii]|uniref:MMPL/RND family transporter n=1 Tax=Mycolicibacterium mengxianglii TaxID=2736649 RepID=UPI0018D1098D|nr:RND family transporter [Mycolicibacterium mengxianglii]
MSTHHKTHDGPFLARTVRRFAVPVIVAWVALTVLLSLGVPSLEQVAKERAVSLSVQDAPSMQARNHIGDVFQESNTDSVAMVVLEGEQPLGDTAHQYYNDLVGQFKAEKTHVQRVQDFWGDPMTAQAVQSADGKAAYVQLNLAGNQGESLANESVDVVRDIVARTPAPDGVKAYVTGPTPLSADLAHTGDHAAIKITIATVVVISIMLLLVYRSITTVILVMVMMGIGLGAVRGVVASLAHFGIIGLSTFSISILVALAIAGGTDYAIFLIGRYHEARQAGEDRETAYYTANRGVSHVILASGLTIAGATFCLSFTRLPIFQTMGVPCAVGMVVAVAAALTLIPAVLTVASRFGLLEPKRTTSTRGWRRVGTAIVRWPLPIFVASCALASVGLLALPGYQVSYEDRPYMPQNTPANIGWAAADRHFSPAQMMPELLMIETDHDMRNSADLLVLNKLAQDVFQVEGIALVQGVTRPEGAPLAHTSLPSLLSVGTAGQQQNLQFVRDRMDDMREQAAGLDGTIATMERAYALMQQLSGSTSHMVGVTHEMVGITKQIRGDIAVINDSYNRYDKILFSDSCNIFATCEAAKTGREAGLRASDGTDKITEKLDELGPDLDNLDTVAPQLVALLPSQIETLRSVQSMMLTTYSTMSGILGQSEDLGANAAAMGQDFDAAKISDSFYLPRDVFDNPEFQRVVKLFMSPDGHAARFIISHRGNPATEQGISRIDGIRTAAEESLKGTSLANSGIYLAGTASVLKDLQEAWNYDLLIAGIASLGIVLIIMLLITRSIIAALVIVGTVVASLGASFGLSVLVWQHIIGIDLHWMVMLMSVIILLAVGADYNLLLVSRFKEEIGAGIKTGMIRAIGGTGKIVTLAGLVFAFTMASMMVSDLLVVGQVGTTIALGLLFDTLIVRSFMMPSAAALLGRWFWWPMKVRNRPLRAERWAGSGGIATEGRPVEDGSVDDRVDAEFSAPSHNGDSLRVSQASPLWK